MTRSLYSICQHLAVVLFVIVTAVACGGGSGSAEPPTVNPPNGSVPASSTPTIVPLGSPRILVSDAATLNRYKSLLAVNAPAAVRFKNMIDVQISGANNYYGFQPWYAALMGQVTGTASYCSYAVTQTESFVQLEEALINANQRAVVAGDSYLEVGPLIGNLAMVYDWCRSSMTAAQRARWVTYANQAVWNVWHHNEAKWGNTTYPWSGWSIDNPVNNYYYSFLEATMLLGLATQGENTQASTWIEQFRTVKIENQLIPTFTRDLVGGGSREGTGYGTAMKNLWRLFDWWERSTGERLASRTPHTLASMAHLMHSIVPTLDKLAPTGDHARDSTAALFDYHRDYLQVLMRLFANERLTGTAKTLLAQSSVPVMANSFMVYSDFMYDASDIAAQPLANLATTYWGSGTGQLFMRASWTPDAAYANFICGPYTESHAHHDQGSFTLYKGNWLAYDANIDSHSGIAQGEGLHNLVRIEQNGAVVSQVEGAAPCQLRALADSALFTYGVANITPTYNGKSQVGKVEREFLFIKPATFVVFDRVQSAGAGIARVWSMNVPVQPSLNGGNFSVVRGTNRLDVMRLAPTGLTTTMHYWPTLDTDISSGYRIDVSHASGNTSEFLHVIGMDGAVSQAVSSDATGQLGTSITLADGRKALVRFSATGSGGTLDIRDAANASLFNGALPASVQVPTLFAN